MLYVPRVENANILAPGIYDGACEAPDAYTGSSYVYDNPSITPVNTFGPSP